MTYTNNRVGNGSSILVAAILGFSFLLWCIRCIYKYDNIKGLSKVGPPVRGTIFDVAYVQSKEAMLKRVSDM